MKKILIFLLTLAILAATAFSLSSCGEDNTDDGKDSVSDNNDPPHEHTPGAAKRENEVKATCTANGSYREVVYCTECNEKITSQQIKIDATGHKYDNRVCTVCKYTAPYSTGLKFVSNGDGTCYVAGIGNCKDTDIVIPMTSPSGDSVTSIGNRAFYDYSGLKTVVICDNIEEIGDRAFHDCDDLISVVMGDGVVSIGDRAFYGCDDLASVVIPDNVTKIGYESFSGCPSLVYNEHDNAYYLSSESNPYAALINAKSTSITSCDIHPSTKVIAGFAFSDCSKLTSIVIPDSVKSIGDSAFSWCSGLTSVEIGDGVTSIGECAFTGCDGLASIVIPDGVTSIGYLAFHHCDSLTDVVIGNGVTEISEDSFSFCPSLTSVVIGDGTTRIGYNAFRGCTSLESIVIGDSVARISNYAFTGCVNLNTVYYKGEANEWEFVAVRNDNSPITNATRYYYSETEPAEDGSFWHYDADGNAVVWGE